MSITTVTASSSSNLFLKQRGWAKMLPNYYEEETFNSIIDSLDQSNNRHHHHEFSSSLSSTLSSIYNENDRVYADDLFEANLLNSWLEILTVDVIKRRLKMLLGHFAAKII